uniref:Leucine-rich repeat-containing N-terminal plant-type domain-containing protein n=1 Tax=Tetradesmus obliquus TaxID=3088 RepID=A0A383VF13_TETOB|eukprot:jgi/Sobl393_1/9918/SZX63254.1
MLPALFSTGQPDWQDKVNSVLQTYRSLPDSFNNASDPTAFRIADPIRSGSMYLEFGFEVVNGAVCVTGINAQSLRVNTTVLTQFLAQLPFLRSFKSDRTCSLEDFCAFPDMPPMPMPLDLAASAPAALTTFELTGNNLTGTLPSQWGQWNSIQELTIRANALVTGTLPESWAGMRSLTSLTLSGNTGLTGPLPALYGTAAWAASLQLMDLSEDEGLNGTIPSSWAGITAAVFDVTDTGLGGCVPDQLLNTLVWSTQPVAKPPYPGTFTGPCSQDSSEMTALLELMSVFGSRNPGLATWTPAPPGYTPEPLPGAPAGPAPYHCRNWWGVSCDASNRVSGLDLASTACSGLQGTPLPLAGALLNVLRKLPWLQSLSLSSCSLQGQLPEALADLANLRQLNLSSNAALSGSLPALWAAMPHMQLLDVSGCALNGSLPAEFAAWQELRELRAAGNRAMGGQLPGSWGLMQSLQVLDLSNTSLTGQLPAAWFESTTSKTASAALLRRVRRQAAAANTSVTAASATGAAADSVSPASLHALSQAVGPAPKALLGLTQLQVLRLAGNRLTGSLPAKVSLLSQLRVLDLSGNAMEGALPLELATLTQLQELQLSGNKLQGSLPDALVRLTQLSMLDLSGNNFTGTLPSLWVSLTQLRSMHLGSNMLSGGVPRLWGRMANAATHSLQLLVLTDNPCMQPAALQESILQSGITQGGRVTVQVSAAYTRQCTAPQP